MKQVLSLLLAVGLLAMAGCGTSGDDAGEEQTKTGMVGKGDCPDCDPHGGSAFEQAQMGLRFYVAGDSWQMAYQFKVRNEMERKPVSAQQLSDDPTATAILNEEAGAHVTDVYLFNYFVTKVDERILDNVKRQVAAIRVDQATPTANQELFAEERLEGPELALVFELDDLLRPVSETLFNAEYPHGKTIQVDKESSLSGLDSGSSLFPHMVPRVLTVGADSSAPAMTPELEAAADALAPGWRGDTYRKFEFSNGDVVFWAKGALWPFYMDSQQGYGLLAGQNLMAR
jgi:hypothetical protein